MGEAYALVMKSIFIFISLFVGLDAYSASRELVILSGHKDAKKLASLDAGLTEKFKFAKGYPKKVRSDSIKGLNPGFWLWIGGFCKPDETLTVVVEVDNKVTSPVALVEQKFLKSALQKVAEGAYIKTVESDENSCPLVQLEKMGGKTDLVAAANEFAGRAQFYESSYLLSYVYKYQRQDEAILRLIDKNEFLAEDIGGY